MNTNEFYKQLMSEYTFDHEKIKKAAMGKVAEKKTVKFPYKWVSVTAAAAVAVTVGIGIVANSGGNPISVSPASITAEERFRLSLEAYERADENTEEVLLYVTFRNSETPTDMQNILARISATGTIKVVEVYTNEKQVISGSTDIQALFDENAENIAAAKIKCPGNLFKKLSNDKAVYLVETADIFEKSDFSVIDTELEYPDYPYTDGPNWETTVPPITTIPVPGDSTPIKEETTTITTVSSPETAVTTTSATTTSMQTSAGNASKPVATVQTPASVAETPAPVETNTLSTN